MLLRVESLSYNSIWHMSLDDILHTHIQYLYNECNNEEINKFVIALHWTPQCSRNIKYSSIGELQLLVVNNTNNS